MEKYEFIRLDRAERWIVVMHPGSPLAQKDYITAEDLKEVPLILPRRLNVRSELAPVSYTHLDVYKRQVSCHRFL